MIKMIKESLLDTEVGLIFSEVRFIENYEITGQSPFQLIFVTAKDGIPVKVLGSFSRKSFLNILDSMGYDGKVNVEQAYEFLLSQVNQPFLSNLHTDSKDRLNISYGTFKKI